MLIFPRQLRRARIIRRIRLSVAGIFIIVCSIFGGQSIMTADQSAITGDRVDELSHRGSRFDQTFKAERISVADAPRWQKISLEAKAEAVAIELAGSDQLSGLISSAVIALNDRPVVPDTATDVAAAAGVTAQTSASQPESVTPQPTASSSAAPSSTKPVTTAQPSADLSDPLKKDIAMQLVSSAENSSLNWRAQYAYLEDIGDGRGYTGGIIGFCSGTGDMLEMVRYYTKSKPANSLAAYIPALERVNGTDSHTGLGAGFEAAWKLAAADPLFQKAQDYERDRVYFDPAVKQAKSDGLRALGQFIYYDAIVMHGPGTDAVSFGGIRSAALKKAKTPAQGGSETAYLNAFLDARVAAMKTEAAHDDVSRVETSQRLFVKAGNFDLTGPLSWQTYGDTYTIR